MNDDLSYSDVMDRAEPYRDERPSYPLEIYVETRESRRSVPGYSGRKETRARFHVVHHGEEEVVDEGRWTTGDHHHPYPAAESRAFGVLSGYRAASDE